MMENSMANILRNVIRNGGMPLSQVNERIETMYLSGRISGEERNELTELMHAKANPENEKGDYKALYEALTAKYNELEARVTELEKAAGGEEACEEIPEWKPWDGVSGGYKTGDVVKHGGKYYVSEYEGAMNVWEPGTPGVDERYWKEITEEEASQKMAE